MINRIVLIGNGFDLAHGMKTSYRDFFAGYWDFIKDELIHSIERYNNKYEIKDKLCTISLKDQTAPWYVYLANNGYVGTSQVNGIDFYNKLKNDSNVEMKISPFFQRICFNVETKNWVDIENEYYKILKDIAFGKNPYSIDKLNEDLDYFKVKLIEYLKLNINDKIEYKIKKDILSPIRKGDMSMHGKKIWDNFMNDRTKWSNEKWTDLINKYTYIESSLGNNIPELIKTIHDDMRIYKNKNYIPYREIPNNLIFSYLPEDIIILNFNYTDTIKRYVPVENSPFLHINIHGSINHINDVIFGYGDELDDDFKKVENINDNKYLKNIKSICYLESDKYRWLLEKINSTYYQVIVMGHSCGNSDRTLLNTLFEHENCISIKPYYYEYKDSDNNVKDNYSDITQNIFRNFTNKAELRNKVVNKGYCNPLLPLPND